MAMYKAKHTYKLRVGDLVRYGNMPTEPKHAKIYGIGYSHATNDDSYWISLLAGKGDDGSPITCLLYTSDAADE